MRANREGELIVGPPANHYAIRPDLVDMTRPAIPPLPTTIAALPQSVRVDLRKSALIIIDMQNEFCSTGGWMDRMGVDLSGAQALYDPINRATRAARASGVPVIWVNWGVRPDRANLSPGARYTFSDKVSFAGLGEPVPTTPGDTHPAYHLLMKDEWGAQVVDELERGPDDIWVDKHRISGFWDTPLDSILRTAGIKTLFFTGVNSDHCVLGTLMDANFHGYDTVLLEDCAATTSPDFCHQAALHNIRFCFGFTATSDDFIAGLAAAA